MRVIDLEKIKADADKAKKDVIDFDEAGAVVIESDTILAMVRVVEAVNHCAKMKKYLGQMDTEFARVLPTLEPFQKQ